MGEGEVGHGRGISGTRERWDTKGKVMGRGRETLGMGHWEGMREEDGRSERGMKCEEEGDGTRKRNKGMGWITYLRWREVV